MFQLISIVKSLVLTLFIVLLLQVKVGDSTLEERAVFWFRSSPLVRPMQRVVDGGVRVLQQSFGRLTGLFDWSLKGQLRQQPGHRDLNFQLERSRKYIRERAEQVARKVESQLESQNAKAGPSEKNEWEGE